MQFIFAPAGHSVIASVHNTMSHTILVYNMGCENIATLVHWGTLFCGCIRRIRRRCWDRIQWNGSTDHHGIKERGFWANGIQIAEERDTQFSTHTPNRDSSVKTIDYHQPCWGGKLATKEGTSNGLKVITLDQYNDSKYNCMKEAIMLPLSCVVLHARPPPPTNSFTLCLWANIHYLWCIVQLFQWRIPIHDKGFEMHDISADLLKEVHMQ